MSFAVADQPGDEGVPSDVRGGRILQPGLFVDGSEHVGGGAGGQPAHRIGRLPAALSAVNLHYVRLVSIR